MKIIKNKGEVSIYQNGTLSVKYKSEGPEWDEMVAKSKFKGWEGFGKYSKGKIIHYTIGDDKSATGEDILFTINSDLDNLLSNNQDVSVY